MKQYPFPIPHPSFPIPYSPFPIPHSLLSAAKSTVLSCALFLCAAACSFDYDLPPENREIEPDVVMRDVEYVRMRGGGPEARMRSKEVRRFEKIHIMEMDDFTFEQYNPPDSSNAPEVNILGSAGTTRIQTDTGNLTMRGGVSLSIASEDLSITTESIEWLDKERVLTAPGRIELSRSDGTKLSGESFSADARRRSWELTGNVEGEMPEAEEDGAEAGDRDLEADILGAETRIMGFSGPEAAE